MSTAMRQYHAHHANRVVNVPSAAQQHVTMFQVS